MGLRRCRRGRTASARRREFAWGCAVPKAIFHRFYRAEAARASTGTGLGLSLVAAIAELHGLESAASDNLLFRLRLMSFSPPRRFFSNRVDRARV